MKEDAVGLDVNTFDSYLRNYRLVTATQSPGKMLASYVPANHGYVTLVSYYVADMF